MEYEKIITFHFGTPESEEVEANKRRAKERNRLRKAEECTFVFILLCVSIPALVVILFACWMIGGCS